VLYMLNKSSTVIANCNCISDALAQVVLLLNPLKFYQHCFEITLIKTSVWFDACSFSYDLAFFSTYELTYVMSFTEEKKEKQGGKKK
jgi:hypothetical protein